MNPKSDNLGKVLSRRIPAQDRATLALTFTTEDANALRSLAQSITLKGNKKPSLTLLAKRALCLYAHHMATPGNHSRETEALNGWVTPVPVPATFSKKAKRPPTS